MPDLPIELPSKVICVGLNYADHAQESGLTAPVSPVTFAKWPSALIGSGEPIVLPAGVDSVDFEAELAVVIDREARDVPADRALDLIRGYTCFNDVSARGIQSQDGQWTRGKSFDSFGPIGPVLVPAAEVPDPQTLDICCRVNGQILQQSNTRHMIFPIAKLIEIITQATTLLPGDVIATGTPGGVGVARSPQRWLSPGDVVEVEIAHVGVLSNPVTAAGDGAGATSAPGRAHA